MEKNEKKALTITTLHFGLLRMECLTEPLVRTWKSKERARLKFHHDSRKRKKDESFSFSIPFSQVKNDHTLP